MKTRRAWSWILVLCMLISLFPVTALAAGGDEIDYTPGSGDYNRVIAQKDYAISPGVSESTLILNDATGQNQNYGYVMAVDPSNQYASFLASYKDMGTGVKNGVYGTQVLSQQAAYAEAHGFNVVGGINTSLRWGSEEPMGMLVINGEVLHDELSDYNYFVLTKDGKAEIREGSVPLDGNEQQAVACFPHWLVKDGKNCNSVDHAQGNRAPRTAIGIRADGSVILFVCDGRNIPTSMGMTLYELAEALIALGCVEATNCDGGGSSTFLSEREGTGQLTMKNTPSDSSERATLGGLLVISTAQPSGTFDHAAITPADNYYTPNSTVPLSATAVDYSGAAAGAIPEDVTWSLTSEGMGTLTNFRVEDGIGKADFVSNGTLGEVNIELKQGDKIVGSTHFDVQAPDTLAFNSDSINLTYEQVTDLGLVAKYQGNALILNENDIRWTISDETIGTFNGLYLTSTSDVLKSASGTVTATYVGNESLTASVTVNIGMKPSVVMDGGDGNEIDPLNYAAGFGRVVARVNNPWGIGYWEIGSPEQNDLITAHYTNNEGNCADASAWRGGNESAEYITTDMPQWTDIIRFGNGAVKLNYDFSQANGIEGACLGFSHDIELTGSPTGIGMWVYAPEGTANLWLRGAVGVETAAGSGVFSYTFINYTERADTAWNRSGGKDVGGINWTGWHYVEADLTPYAGRTIRIMAGETVRVMFTNGKYGPTVNGVVTGMGGLTADGTIIPKEECKGWILVDNLQFVYGANNEDVTEPTVSGVQYSTSKNDLNRIELENGAELNVTGRPCFWFDYNDNEYTDRYATGVATKLFYFDGMLVGGGYSVDAEGYVFIEKYLSNGPHTITCYVKDKAGNITRETRNFTITGANETYQSYPTMSVEYSDELYLGDEFTLNLKSDYQDLSNVSNVEATINMNRNYPVKDVVFSDDFDGSYEYTAGVLKITGHVKDGVTTASNDVIFTVIVGVPTTLTEGSNYNFEVASVIMSLKTDQLTDKNVLTWSLALPTKYLPIQAKYSVKADVVIAGHDSVLHVYDVDGMAAANVGVYTGDTLLGTTDADGALVTNFFADPSGRWSVYAKDENGAVSFPVTIRCSSTVGEQTPYYILSNAVSDPSTEKNLTWMSNPDYAAATAQVRLSTSADMSNARIVDGTSKALAYRVSEVANYSNQVVITGLQPATEYFYQVGDGTVWSDVRSFTTAATKDTVTNFFVIGDMQGEDAKVAEEYSDLMKESGVSYDFGVQLGDAIDNPDKYDEWQGSLGVFSKGIFGDLDIVHVIGNHETFASAENTASSARAIFGVPADDASGYYSFEYGNVYVAVIGYTLDQSIMQASMDWLLQDASASECPWKILVMHVPTYYSNSEQTDSTFYVNHLPAVAEAAGITAVFSGHDHSYARTEVLNGVTYIIAGTAGEKKYACDANGFAFVETHGDGEPIATPTQNYGALYLSLSATSKRMTLTTYNVDENGVQTVFDRAEWGVPVCTDHEFVYNRDTDMLTCSVCGTTQKASDSLYSGFARDEETGKLMYLAAGKVMTGYQYISNERYYFDAQGLAKDGEFTICGVKCTFEDGRYISCAEPGVLMAGWCGENAEFVMRENGVLRIEGTGSMYDYQSYGIVPWQPYILKIQTASIGSGVTTLGRYAFRGARALTQVVFDENSSFVTVGKSAFSGAKGLTEIILPDSTKKIDYHAFTNCPKLVSVYIPDNLSNINSQAFTDSDPVLSVAKDSYAEEWARTNGIRYEVREPQPSDIASGDNWVLDADGVLTISGNGPLVTGTTTSSSPWYEYRTQVKQAVIGKDVTQLGAFAFYGCSNLESVTFEEGSAMKRIQKYNFYGCSSLKEIIVPDGVKSIEYAVFKKCPALTSVYLPDGIANINATAFDGSANVVASVAAGSYAASRLAELNVAYVERPVDVTEIASGDNWVLTSDGVLTISGNGPLVTGTTTSSSPWYEYRTQVKQAVIGKDVTQLGAFAFYGCSNLESVTFEEGSAMKRIQKYNFYGCSSLKEIVVPDGVKSIEYAVFKKCPALTSVYLPDWIADINATAFDGSANVVASVAAGSYAASRLAELNVAYVERPVDVTEIASGDNWVLTSDGVLTISGNGPLVTGTTTSSSPWYEYRTQVKQAVIGKDVTQLGAFAFYGCSNLESVTFEEGSAMKRIQKYNFYGCSSLKEIVVPDGVKSIEYAVFKKCPALTSVYLPDGIANINATAFDGSVNVVASVAAGSYAASRLAELNVAYVERTAK